MSHSSGKSNQGAGAFAALSSSVGLVSSIFGIIQFIQQSGKDFGARIWDALYSMGFIALNGLLVGGIVVAVGLFLVGIFAKQSNEKTGSDSNDRVVLWICLIVGLAVGVCLGLPMAKHNLEVLAMDPLQRLQSHEQPFPPMIMRAIGALAIAAPFLSYWANNPDPSKKVQSPPTQEPG